MTWDMVMLVLILYNVFAVPVSICFDLNLPPEHPWCAAGSPSQRRPGQPLSAPSRDVVLLSAVRLPPLSAVSSMCRALSHPRAPL